MAKRHKEWSNLRMAIANRTIDNAIDLQSSTRARAIFQALKVPAHIQRHALQGDIHSEQDLKVLYLADILLGELDTGNLNSW